MTGYGNVYGILSLKLPGKPTGQQKFFKTDEHIYEILILVQYKIFCCGWWNMSGELSRVCL